MAFDLDDTLLQKDKTISKIDLEAIKEAMKKGVYVILATGRPIFGTMQYINLLGLSKENYMVSFNGAISCSIDGNDVVLNEKLSGLDLAYLYDISKKLNVNIHAFDNRGCISPRISEYTNLEVRINDIPLNIVDFSTIENDDEIIKIMFVDEADYLDSVIKKLPSEIYEKYNVVKSAPFFLEFLNKKADKWYGVEAIAKRLDIKNDEIICFGDSENDHLMIEKAGMGIAMGNAIQSVKEVAKYITLSNDKNGIAYAINKFILEKA